MKRFVFTVLICSALVVLGTMANDDHKTIEKLTETK